MELPFAVPESSSIQSFQTIIQQPGTDRSDNDQLLSSASSNSSSLVSAAFSSEGDSNSYIAASSQQTVESGYIATEGSIPSPNPHVSTINPSHNNPGQTFVPTETLNSRQYSITTHPLITPTIVALPPKQLNSIPSGTSTTIPVSVVTSTTSSVASKVTSMFSNFARFTTGAVSAATTPSTTSAVTNEKNYHSQPITSNSISLRSTLKSTLTSTKDRGQRIISPAPSNNSSSSYDDGEDTDHDHADNGGDSSLSTEIIDFAYVNVTDEDEIDVWFDNHSENHHKPGFGRNGGGTSTLFFESDDENKSYNVDILTILLSGRIQTPDVGNTIDETKVDNEVVASNRLETMIRFIEDGNEAALNASIAKKNGNMQESFQKHSEAAKYFYEGAVAFRESKNGTFQN